MARIGLLGCGTVGSGVIRLLSENRAILDSVLSESLEITHIAVRDVDKARDDSVPRALLSTDAAAVAIADDVDIVVELMGGLEPAHSLVAAALEAGKPVVTANKTLMAHHGQELLEKAAERGTRVYFEAAVAGGIPIIRAMREGLAANAITGIYGIVNGTSNYILSEMTRAGRAFQDVLAEAQKAGYAEADPTLDVGGIDAAEKLSVLAACAFGLTAEPERVLTEGIDGLTPLDLEYAAALGYVVKPLAIATREESRVTMRVHPTMLPATHLLATVNGVFNAVYVTGQPIGPTLYYGRGAGAGPTASAVVADLLQASRQLGVSDMAPHLFPVPETRPTLGDPGKIVCEYYLRFNAWDRPGVLSKITGILGENGISIARLLQREHKPEDVVPVVVLTHPSTEAFVRKAVAQIDREPVVAAKTLVLRVEELEGEVA